MQTLRSPALPCDLRDADEIYLVGDIVDAGQLRSGWHGPRARNDMVQRLLRLARPGARVVYLPGHPDELARDGAPLDGVAETVLQRTADGRRRLVIHGDHADAVVRLARWRALVGDHAGLMAQLAERIADAVRRRMGLPRVRLAQAERTG
jgi:UDP-2,3-diacylglucosamine pyrophosphatase LpxH